jgi:8-amino-7-oxononanoate synthase
VSDASFEQRVERALERIAAEGRLRTIQARQPPADAIDFSTNDYLGLATDARVVQALRHATRVGSGGARLLGGRHREHSLLEEELAEWLGRESALLFSSGYLATMGSVAALGALGEAVYSDALNHASLIDGVRLSGAQRFVYPHAALPGSEERRTPALVVSETLFSMDGDIVDPQRLAAHLGADDALVLDEAHALGVYGPQGAGLAHGVRDRRAIVAGTLSKSLGALGGFVAGPKRVIDLLANTARTFVFDTALPPAIALAARVALSIVRKADDRRERVRENAVRLRAGLEAMGLEVCGADASQIVPVVLGDERRALAVSRALLERHVYAPAIRPPSVPAGTSRLRISVRADHDAAQIDLLLRELRRAHTT